MKITFKTLKGEQFQIDIEPTQTILNLKESVQQQKGLEIDTIKLVHKGKQHPDEKTIQECNIQEGEFIVITTTKKPNQPQQQPQQSTQQQPQQQAQNTSQVTVQSTIQASQQNTAQNRPANNNQQQSGNNLVIGEEHRQNVEMIVAMGFEKEKVELALRAAYMNPDRAIEYLINNNIPSFDQQDPNMSGDQDDEFGEGGDLPEQLEALANQPMFVRLREAISQNPAMLQPIMQNIQEESPEIFQLIQSYPQLLLGNGQQGGGGQQQQSQQNRNQNRIMITQEDKEAIERIHSLGFSKQDSLEAYLACGRDENMAVNLLLEKQEKGDLYSQEDDQALIQQAIEQSNLQQQQQPSQQQQQQQQQQPPQNPGDQSGSNNNNQGNNNSSGNNNNNGGNNNNNNNGGDDNIFD